MKKISLLDKFEEHQIENLKTVNGGWCKTYRLILSDMSTVMWEADTEDTTGHIEGQWGD